MEAPPISWLMAQALNYPGLISLAAGFTDDPSLPVERTRALMQEILSDVKTGQAALQYGTTVGDLELRRATAERLTTLDKGAISIGPDQLVMTHGSQQLLYLVAECLFDPGDIVILEDPTYFVYLGIMQGRGVRCRGVRMESDGVDLACLEAVLEEIKAAGELSRVKLFYSISYFQNPSGVTTSLEKKQKTLELLARYEREAGHPIYFLEDGAYRELSFDKNFSISSSLSLAKHASRVIYTGTYTKSFATGLRVGFGVLPEPLCTHVLRAKGNHDFGTANMMQKLLCRAMQQGDYVAHLEELRVRYQGKAKVMQEAMQEHFPKQVRWAVPQGGLYFWVKLPRAVSTGAKSKFFKAALDNEVLYVPGELCYAEDPARQKPDNEMRLSFGSATESNIQKGIARLGQAVKACLG